MAKKTEVITFRTDSETKENLEKIAEKNKWSIALVVDEICKEYFSQQKNKSTNYVNQTTINIHNEQHN